MSAVFLPCPLLFARGSGDGGFCCGGGGLSFFGMRCTFRGAGGRKLAAVDVELDPDQPEPVVRAVEELLRADEREPDPWWKAGINEALGND